MAWTEIRDRGRTLRYRGLLVKQMVPMKNCTSGLLLEEGAATLEQRRAPASVRTVMERDRGEPHPAGTGASRLAQRCYIGN
jgi:hypothetical protein